jgi:hypothetical protein
MGRLCKKCGYERKPEDFAPDYECPKCGAVYTKVEDFLQRQQEEKRLAETAAEEKMRREQQQEQERRDKEKQRQAKEHAKWGVSDSTYVGIQGRQITVNVNSVDEAKLALKELKLKKKEFGLLKRSITEKQKEIRADYTGDVRSRGSMMRGGGGLGKLVRVMQSASRDARRAQLARNLEPLEAKKQEIEAMIRAIDSAILQVEAALLKHNG